MMVGGLKYISKSPKTARVANISNNVYNIATSKYDFHAEVDAAMTMPASYSEPFGQRLPNTDESDCANQLRKIMAARMSADHEVVLDLLADDEKIRVVLNSQLSKLLMDVLRVIGRGDAATLVPVSQQLTTQQAADVLNVSRPYLISKLLDTEIIPHSKVGRHRRISAADIFEYKNKMREDRAAALSGLAEQDADLL